MVEVKKSGVIGKCSPMLQEVMRAWLTASGSNTGFVTSIEGLEASPLGRKTSVSLRTPKPPIRKVRKTDTSAKKKKQTHKKNEISGKMVSMMVKKYENGNAMSDDKVMTGMSLMTDAKNDRNVKGTRMSKKLDNLQQLKPIRVEDYGVVKTCHKGAVRGCSEHKHWQPSLNSYPSEEYLSGGKGAPRKANRGARGKGGDMDH